MDVKEGVWEIKCQKQRWMQRKFPPRKPFGFPGEDGSIRRCSRDEDEEEGRRRVGEEEEDEEEDEDRLDVVGLDECSSSRPGKPFES